jgi:hypothetical protein
MNVCAAFYTKLATEAQREELDFAVCTLVFARYSILSFEIQAEQNKQRPKNKNHLKQKRESKTD